MSPIEVMAKAMWEKESLRAFGKPRNIAWGDVDKYTVAKWHGLATAALIALSQMEPTPGMELEGKSVSWCTGENGFSENCVNCSEVFRAMLAAAVKENYNG